MVEWKKMGDVCSVHTGNQLNRNDMIADGLYPVVNGGKDFSGYTNSYNETANNITISQGGESAGFVNWISSNFWAGAHCYVVEHDAKLDKRFLYHTLKNKERDIQLSKQGAGIPGLNRNTLYNQIIPIPSLSEQTRIVRILDTFTASIDNLKEQIAERRKQYEHYRDQLLDLEGKEWVKIKKLGDICDFIRGPFGGALKKEIFVQSGYAIYEQQHAIYGNWDFRYYIDSNKFEEMKRFEVHSGDILMSCSGTMGKTSIVPDSYKPGIINQALLKLSVQPIISNRFLKLFMDSRWFQEGLKNKTAGGAIQNVASVSVLKDLKIPVPSIGEQSRIVSILDTFEACISNLEAQLKQREKQYEYYRNKLLTFE